MAREIELYPYQLPSVDALHQGFLDGHRAQILMAPTGFGKTVVAAHLLKLTAANRKRCAIMVDRVNLVDQTSKSLDFYGIDHGIIQGGHWRRRAYEPIQVCSAQTLEKRGFFPDDLNLLIVDECHEIRRATAEFIKSRPNLYVIGLSATPFTKGLTEIYSNLVNVCTTNELLNTGDLTPLKMYAAKAANMEGAKVVAGEWSDKEAGDRGIKIVGDIVAEWQSKTYLHFGRAVKTIVFSATVAHGAELCRQFNAAGYNFQQISYQDTDEDERRALIEEFKKSDSEIDGLVSCEVFTKGFDVKDILCGIAARPYRKSLSSHIQQMGRVMRKSPGKEFGLWLDHSGNLLRFKDDVEKVFEHGLSELSNGQLDAKARKEPTPKEKEQWSCSCGYVFPSPMSACPACGKERLRLNMVENVAGVMEAVGHEAPVKSKMPAFLEDKESVWRQICGLAWERKGGDFDAARRFAQSQFNNIYGHFSKTGYSTDIALEPSREVKSRVQSNIIRWAKGKAKGKGLNHAVS
ncbi:helicase [Achromobacter sp. KS-M25]|nr:helicase [Achromobacter aestuarii]